MAISSFLSVNKRDAIGKRVTRRLGSSAKNIVSYKLPPIKRGDLVVPVCQQKRRIRKKSHTTTWLVRQQHRKLQTFLRDQAWRSRRSCLSAKETHLEKKSHTTTWLVRQQHRKLQTSSEIKRGDRVTPICQQERCIRKKESHDDFGSSANNIASYKLPPRSSVAISSFLSVNKRDAPGKKSLTRRLGSSANNVVSKKTSSEIKRGDLVVPICQQKRRIRKKGHTATWLVRQQHRKLQTSSEIKRGDLVVPTCQQKRRIRKKGHTATWLVRQQHRKLQTSSEIKRGDLVVPTCQQKRRISKKSQTVTWLVRQQHR